MSCRKQTAGRAKTTGIAGPGRRNPCMAIHLNSSLVYAEIDNTRKGKVTGIVKLLDLDIPFHLALEGDCEDDLKGCKLIICNPNPQSRPLPSPQLACEQNGQVEIMTASRKVSMVQSGKKLIANSLYLEWHSQQNGRIIIEGAGFNLTVLAPDRVLPYRETISPSPEENWETTEEPFRSEILKESEPSSTKRAQLAGWSRLLHHLNKTFHTDFSTYALKNKRKRTNRKRSDSPPVRHPLTKRCEALCSGIWEDASTFTNSDEEIQNIIAELISETCFAGVKFATAIEEMNTEGEEDPAFILNCLRRALDRIRKSLNLLLIIKDEKVLPETIENYVDELFELHSETLKLIRHYRKA